VTRSARIVMVCVAVLAAASALGAVASDPVALLELLGADAGARSKAASGRAVLTILPARGRDLAVFGVARTTAGGGRLVSWTRAIERLYQGRYVPAIGRFSEPPRLDDLEALVLDDEDARDVRSCRPGDCDLQLSASEMERIRQAAETAGAEWRPAVQRAFREVVLARATAYLASGLSEGLPYHDREHAVSPQDEFEALAARLGSDLLVGSRVLPYLTAYPDGDRDDVESFLYWSTETLGGGKPIVTVTHVAIFRSLTPGAPGTVIAARQVFATHYLTGSLSVTAITGAAADAPGYLVYIRRSRTDAFEGTFGALVRLMVERRIRSEGPDVLDALRRKLEGGEPPGATSTR
jgi:hypothetical protein